MDLAPNAGIWAGTHGAEQHGVLGRVVGHAEHRELGAAGKVGKKREKSWEKGKTGRGEEEEKSGVTNGAKTGRIPPKNGADSSRENHGNVGIPEIKEVEFQAGAPNPPIPKFLLSRTPNPPPNPSF